MGYESRDSYRPGGFGGFSFLPPIIKKLLILNVAVFFVQLIFDNLMFGGVSGREILSEYFALNPLFARGANFQIWQLFSYQFMHANFSHIFFNMLMLWMFGMELENTWGSRKFVFYYLLCGVVAGLFQIIIGPLFGGGFATTIGASGAVFGILIAFGMYFPDRKIYLYFLVPVKAKYLIGFLVIIEFLSISGVSIIAHMAHIGGAVCGFLFIMLDRKYHFNIDKLFDYFKSLKTTSTTKKQKPSDFKFRKPSFFSSAKNDKVQEASFYDISEDKKESISADSDEIDRILDKISQSGYQNLTDEEKKILFEASKKN